jgi:hypothetical protein
VTIDDAVLRLRGTLRTQPSWGKAEPLKNEKIGKDRK